MKYYLLFVFFSFALVNVAYLYGSMDFLFNSAPYYMSGFILLGCIIFLFRKKYGLSLVVIAILTFVSGEAIITYQENTSHKNAVKTVTIIEKYKEKKGSYPSESEFKELSLPKSIIGFVPSNLNYIKIKNFYSLEYSVYHGYIRYYDSISRKWIVVD